MILLQPDCLVFKTSQGENIPCSAQEVTLELMGDSAALLNDEVIHHAAQAVLHYFKLEVGKTLVSVGEFAQALERVLRGLGFDVQSSESEVHASRSKGSDLRLLASESGKAFELVFFQRLRQEMKRQLHQSPDIIRFHGLRACVKELIGAKRWTTRCQTLNDQIVEFLRTCLITEAGDESCPLVVM